MVTVTNMSFWYCKHIGVVTEMHGLQPAALAWQALMHESTYMCDPLV